MKQILSLALIAVLGLSSAGCASAGKKVVKHKVKNVMPGAQTVDEKVTKKADRVVGDDNEGVRRNRDK
jgi:hypothetical protein